MSHYDYYKDCFKDVKTLKDRIESKIGLELRQYGKHLFIGNMVYSYHMNGGKPIPTYCYKCDYKEGENNKFYPIYDRNGIYVYGWHDFRDCCRIYDVISREINKRS